jgi:hypothetical protein
MGGTIDNQSGGGTLAVSPGDNGLSNLVIPGSQTQAFANWHERVGDYSPWDDVFSVTEQETSLVVDVPFAQRYLFMAYAVGFSYVDPGMNLRRVNPLAHPYYPWLRVARCSCKGVRFRGKGFVQRNPYAPGISAALGSATYQIARFNLGFTNYPWRFLEDGAIAGPQYEYLRNTWVEEDPTSQFLAAEGGAAQMWYADDYTSSGGPKGGTNTTTASSFRAPFGTIVSQIRYVLHWRWVPYNYAFYSMIPTNLYTAMNKLNQGWFLDNFYPGTCLFEPPKIKKYVAPLQFVGGPAYYCDIDVPFVYFNPPPGVTSPAQPGYGIRGHNLVPFRGNNLWYPATRAQAASQNGGPLVVPPSTAIAQYGLFPYTDESQIFMPATTLPP